MTEYTTSSEAIREFMSARERTALWVRTHSRAGVEPVFSSPSVPPSTPSDSDAPSYGPSDSDEGSSHSLPPRMVLRYNDGRPDIPIAQEPSGINGLFPRSRRRGNAPLNPPGVPPVSPRHSRSKSGSHVPAVPSQTAQIASRHAQSLSYATSHHTAAPQPPQSSPTSPRPESIVVFPSRQATETPHTTVPIPSASSHHSHYGSGPHSRSLSTEAALAGPEPQILYTNTPPAPEDIRPLHNPSSPHSHHSSQHNIIAPSPRHAFNPSQIPVPAGPPPIAYSQSQPLPPSNGFNGVNTRFVEQRMPSSRAQSQLPYTYSPPAIVYAPSSKHSRSNYAPPAIVYSPSASHHAHPRQHAPSITYSHSAPLPQAPHQSAHPSHAGPTPYHSVHGSISRRPGSAIPEEPMNTGHHRSHGGRSRGGSVSRGRAPAPDIITIEHSRSRSPTPSESGSEPGSRTSGSTYYVLPTPGQKVKLIVPNSASIYTATSTTKSAHSPQSAHSAGSRKPFFQRIFSIPKLAGSASSSEGVSGLGKRLQRRHTIGGAHMQGRPGILQR
ncbi:hypothetical protein AcV7_002588 [Taiwanofungus camphoratus]|nr:hypothetical protein AcV7_002588 [Antrodia cinnamomea]